MQIDFKKTISNFELFADCNDKNLERLAAIAQEVILKPGELLIREGDPADSLLLVIDGTLDVKKGMHQISQITAGETIGEMTLLEGGTRSASIYATNLTKLIYFPTAQLQTLITDYPELQAVYRKLGEQISKRLRTTNEVTVKALEKKIEEFKTRVSMGRFLVNTITLICLFTFMLNSLFALMRTVKSSTMITIPLMLVVTVFYIINMLGSQIPMKQFGFTLENTKKSIIESVLFSIPMLGIILLYKYILIHTVPSLYGKPLFDPYLFTKKEIWLAVIFIYALVVAPIQELLARGGLQGPLEFFLYGKHKTLVAIVVSNIIFSTMHLFMSVSIAAIIFLPGLFFGWLYSRHHNLIGVSIAHAMIGIWGLSIVGIPFK